MTGGRRVLGQHQIEGLPGPQRILLRRDGHQDVTALGDLRVLLAEQAERGEPVLFLEFPDAGHVVRAVDQGAAEDEHPGARRLLQVPYPGGEFTLPARADEGEVARVGTGGALTDVVEVVGGDPHQFEGEVPVAHVRMGQDDRLVAQMHPGRRVQGVVVGASAVAVRRVQQALGMPEVVDGRVRDRGRVPWPRHPVVPQPGVVDVREPVDERLLAEGVGVLTAPVAHAARQDRFHGVTERGDDLGQVACAVDRGPRGAGCWGARGGRPRCPAARATVTAAPATSSGMRRQAGLWLWLCDGSDMSTPLRSTVRVPGHAY